MSDAFAAASPDVQIRALIGQLRHDATMTDLDTPESAARRLQSYADRLDQILPNLNEETDR